MEFDVAEIERRAKAKKLTIAEVCWRAGVHTSTYQRWKSRHHLPSLRLLKKINEVLDRAT